MRGSYRWYLAAVAIMLACVLALPGTAAPKAGATKVTVTIAPTSGTTLTTGASFLANVNNVNTTSGSLTFADNFVLIEPNGKRLTLPFSSSVSLPAGGSRQITAYNVSTAEFTSQTGQFSLEVDAVDSSGAQIGKATAPFTIHALPAGVVAPRFADVGPSLGVAPVHHTGSDCINRMGTGAGWGDYNGDGWLDLFVSDFNGASHLYKNTTGATRTPSFTDVTASAFPGSLTNSQLILDKATGVTWADYDNDGHPDLLVSATGHPYLFHNNGNATFTDVTAAAGLAGLRYRGESAAWGDFNRDGLLDLYVVYYAQDCFGSPIASTPRAPDHLFVQNPNHTFSDVTSMLGGTSNPAVNGLGFQAVWLDYNNDGWPDLYVVNDFGTSVHRNVLWRNNGGTSFTDVSSSARLNFGIDSMGVGVGDYNRDGYLDVAVSNIGENALAKGGPGGVFTYVPRDEGVTRSFLSLDGSTIKQSITWGLGFFDLNNDGYEDLFMAGGSLRSGDLMPNAVFLNNVGAHLTGLAGDGTFLDVTSSAGTALSSARTVAFGDFDADGYMDAYLVPWYGQTDQLYRNQGPADGNTNDWLDVRLVGAGPAPLGSLPHGSNRDGIGARLTLTSASGTQYRAIMSGGSLGAGNQPATHFGLGHDTQVQSLKIDWPSGSSQTFTNVNANQRIVVTEGSSTIGTDPSRGQSVAGEAGNGGREKQEFNAADQKAARAAVLHRADLARSARGWTGGFVKPDLSSAPRCANFHPDFSKFVLTGAAEGDWANARLQRAFGSAAEVLKTARMVSLEWKQQVQAPGFLSCFRSYLTKVLASQGEKVTSVKRIPIPHIAQYSAAYLVLADVKAQGHTLHVMNELIFIGRRRTEITLQASARAAERKSVSAQALHLARVLVARARA